MKLIEASLAHCEVLAELHAQGFDAPWTVKAFTSALSSPGVFTLIAVKGEDEPLGFVLVRVGGGEAEIQTLVTGKAARRSGVAKALMDAVLFKIRSAEVDKIFLEVATDNLAAQNLYRGLGFAKVGRRKAYYDRGTGGRVDALVMSLAV